MHRISFFSAALFVLPLVLQAQGFDSSASFGGPSVLGRSMGAGTGGRARQVRLRPFITVRGIYDTGLTAARVDTNGEIDPQNLYGVQGTAGIYGTKTWRQSQLSLSFIAGYRNYANNNAFNGFNLSAAAGYSVQINRRVSFNTTNIGGTMNRSYGLGFGLITPGQTLDPATNPLPVDDFFDNRVNFFSTSNTVTYLFNSRLSAGVTGGIFVNNRSDGLISARGSMASGDVAYRLSRRQTVSMSYGYNQFNFDQQYGDSFMQMLGVSYGLDFGRDWRLNLRALGYRLENEGLQRVQIAPEIAAIIGISTGFESFYNRTYLPGYDVSLSKSFRNMSGGAYWGNSVTPGNGVYLTSRTARSGLYYSYTGIRKWSFNVRGSYFSRKNLLRYSGKSDGYNAGVAVGYQLSRDLNVSATADYRDQSSQSAASYGQRGWRYSLGISYSPGDVPLAIF